MIYKKFRPSPILSDLVECHYVWDGGMESYEGKSFDSPPSGFTSITFNYGDPYRLTNCKYNQLIVPPAFIAGQSLYRYAITMSGRIGAAGTVFKPAGLHSLFGIDMISMVEERRPISLLLNANDALAINDALKNAMDMESRAGLLDSLFVKEVQNRQPRADVIDHCAYLIASNHGMLSIQQLEAESNLSLRSLERGFLRKVGISPKKYIRICRIGHVCNLIAGKRKVDWMTIIGDTTFYDQAHFIREFEKFIGEPPSTYLTGNKELANYLSKPSKWLSASKS